MEDITEFSQTTKENIGYYVYCLIDPRNNEIFYIGKGCGNRVFDHQQEEGNNPKNIRIKDIQNSGKDIKKYIIRFGLTEGEAFHLEAALIDIFSSPTWSNRQLLNIMRGHNVLDHGMKSVDEIEAYFCVDDINKKDIKHNVLIVNINKTYATLNDIYESTRKSWIIGENSRANIDLVISEYKGIFRKIYKPTKWYKDQTSPKGNRWMFDGEDVSNKYPQYINKRNNFKKRGNRSPAQFVWGNTKLKK
jgi:hypothetical protein